MFIFSLFSLNKAIFSIPTISTLLKLYDNYDLNAYHNEVVTAAEKKEEDTLLDTFLNTSVMVDTIKFLQLHSKYIYMVIL